MAAGVEIVGYDAFLAKLKGMPKEIEKASVKQNNITGLKVLTRAKTDVHVITGRLRTSIRIRPATPHKNEATVFTDVEYAPHEEFGTRFRPAHPYMFPALIKERPKHARAIRAHVAKILRARRAGRR